MDEYSEQSQKLIKDALDNLIAVVAKVTSDENVTQDSVEAQIVLLGQVKSFNLNRSLNSFNVFLKYFKSEYADKKEQFKNSHPDLKFAVIAKLYYDKISIEEKERLVALEKEKAKKFITEDDSERLRAGLHKMDAIANRLYFDLKVESFTGYFIPKKKKGDFVVKATFSGEKGEEYRNYFLEKFRSISKKKLTAGPRKVTKIPTKTAEWNMRRTDLNKRLLSAYSDCTNKLLLGTNKNVSRIPYGSMLLPESAVKCTGWPEGVPFATPSTANGDAVIRLEEALDRNNVKFSVVRDILPGPEVNDIGGPNELDDDCHME
ncbi:hypothetical protein BD770DRAFT_432731 [Pilaira anomala]|nr:hypothetical protein BD770DRAFT_432731 [Pilaira anomala]